MLYRMRAKDGTGTPFSSGTLVAKDGNATPLAAAEFSIEETASWTSPRTGAVYPARWTIRVPSAALTLDVVPLVADQELVTEKSTRVTYWEGACDVFDVREVTGGRRGGFPKQAPRTGTAYVEMTGYAGEGALGAFR
jgi:predicted secreted hydrolase